MPFALCSSLFPPGQSPEKAFASKRRGASKLNAQAAELSTIQGYFGYNLNGNLASFDMEGSERGIGCTTRKGYCAAIDITREPAIAIMTAYPANVPDILVERRKDGAEPVFGRDRVADEPTAQDVLRDQRHESCVMKILLQRIAPPDPLDDQTGRLPDHFSTPGLAAAEGTSVAKREVPS
jgi:hypothetical protein